MKPWSPAGLPAPRACVPLRWWSESQLRRVAEHARHAALPWARDWELGVGEARAWNTGDEALPGDDAVAWAALPSREEATLRIGTIAGDARRLLHRLMFGSPVGTDDGLEAGTIAQHLARHGADELQHALGAAWSLAGDGAGVGDSQMQSQPPAAESRRWSGAVRLRLTLGSMPDDVLWLHVPYQLALRCLGEPTSSGVASPSGALARITSAMERQPLRLRAALSPVHVDVGGLLGLRLGDVITTSHRLDEPLHVELSSGGSAIEARPLGVGQLGARGSRKAIALHTGLSRDSSSRSKP